MIQSAVAATHSIQLERNTGQAYRRGLRTGVAKALARGDRRIVVDCSAWSDFDLILLSALVTCALVCTEQGAEFYLANLAPDVRNRIQALQLDQRFSMIA
jgi:anti-anti-sigma regulatory factor